MDICALRDKLYGRGVTEAAMRLDADAVRELEQRYQKDWEDNKSYLDVNQELNKRAARAAVMRAKI